MNGPAKLSQVVSQVAGDGNHMCQVSTAIANLSLGGKGRRQRGEHTPEKRLRDMLGLLHLAKDEIGSSDFWRCLIPCSWSYYTSIDSSLSFDRAYHFHMMI